MLRQIKDKLSSYLEQSHQAVGSDHFAYLSFDNYNNDDNDDRMNLKSLCFS